MALREDKIELLVHKGNPNHSLYELPFVCQSQAYSASNGNMFHPVNSVKDLGVIVSSELSWSNLVIISVV